jgi:hypothetical protein
MFNYNFLIKKPNAKPDNYQYGAKLSIWIMPNAKKGKS